MSKRLKESVFSKTEPKDTNVVWYQPTEEGIKEKVYNGGWKGVSGNGGGSSQAENAISTTWAEIKSLRDNSQLSPGSFYRITDYVTTTTQSETKSANHPFDVIVLALSDDTLGEDAKAMLHEGDTYFADSDLSAWELKYCLDNDSTRFAWADKTNGKGVIYRMVDEKRNDCPYDFKNILFYYSNFIFGTSSDEYYTFSYVVSGVLYDGTTEKRVKDCCGNVIGGYYSSGVLQLNKNVFRNTYFGHNCSYNTFGDCCYSNTFEGGCNYNHFLCSCSCNIFGSYCYYNYLRGYCHFNTFWDNCSHNTFGESCLYNSFDNDCTYNTFNNRCQNNTFGEYCCFNTFGNSCEYNELGYDCCFNTFGNSCEYNELGYDCSHNTFGENCGHNIFESYCKNNTFGGYCSYRNIEADSKNLAITIFEEFYDDGSGQVVPIKHPDLSTQPSILPYKFMGQYVYEQLIPVSSDDHKDFWIIFSMLDNLPIPSKKISFLSIELLFIGKYKILEDSFGPNTIVSPKFKVNWERAGYDDPSPAPRFTVEDDFTEFNIDHKYVKVVYTSMPEEDGYYGYNNYGGG